MKKLICCRCKKEINQKKDRWVTIQDFDKGKKTGDKSMHLICWKVMFKEKMQKLINEKARQLSPMIGKLIGGLQNA